MRLSELAQQIGATVHCPGPGGTVDVDQVYAGDRISDLLAAAGDHALLISNLASGQLVRVAELMDIPAICLVNGQEPDAAMRAAAAAHGTMVFTSRVSLFATSGRVHAALTKESQEQ